MHLLAVLFILLIAGGSLWLLLDPHERPINAPNLIEKVVYIIVSILLLTPIFSTILAGLNLLIHLLIG